MELSDEIYSMYGELKESLKLENMDQRKAKKDLFDRRMEDLIKCYDPYRELHKPVESIRKGLGTWFTCILYPGMEPPVYCISVVYMEAERLLYVR